MKNWKQLVVGPDTPLGESIICLDKSGMQMVLVVDSEGKLAGILSDGDIRRAILRGQGDLSIKTSEIMNVKPTTAKLGTPSQEVIAMMRRKVLHHMPIVDENNVLTGLVTMDDVTGMLERPNWVVLMAGGIGKRLRPLTETCPKPMLPVGGKPILENIVEGFIEQGFRNFYLSVNYMADTVCNYFGDGNKWGARIEYLHEKKKLGTAGALSLLPERPVEPFFVMNGDLLTKTRFDNMLEFHTSNNAVATMAVREYEFQVPYGVVNMDGTKITGIEEKPVNKCYVSAGIYTIEPSALDAIPANSFYDMPTLFEDLISRNKNTVAYPLREYWLDIGRLDEYERAHQEWSDEDHS